MVQPFQSRPLVQLDRARLPLLFHRGRPWDLPYQLVRASQRHPLGPPPPVALLALAARRLPEGPSVQLVQPSQSGLVARLDRARLAPPFRLGHPWDLLCRSVPAGRLGHARLVLLFRLGRPSCRSVPAGRPVRGRPALLFRRGRLWALSCRLVRPVHHRPSDPPFQVAPPVRPGPAPPGALLPPASQLVPAGPWDQADPEAQAAPADLSAPVHRQFPAVLPVQTDRLDPANVRNQRTRELMTQ